MSDQRWLQWTSISREVSCFVLHNTRSLHTRNESGQSLPPLRSYSHQQERFELLNHDEQNPFSQGIPNNENRYIFLYFYSTKQEPNVSTIIDP